MYRRSSACKPADGGAIVRFLRAYKVLLSCLLHNAATPPPEQRPGTGMQRTDVERGARLQLAMTIERLETSESGEYAIFFH